MLTDTHHRMLELTTYVCIILVCTGALLSLASFIYELFRNLAIDYYHYRLESLQDKLFRLYIQSADCPDSVDHFARSDFKAIFKRISKTIHVIPYIAWLPVFLQRENKEIEQLASEWNQTWKEILQRYEGTPLKEELVEIDETMKTYLLSAYCWNSPINTAWRWLIGADKDQTSRSTSVPQSEQTTTQATDIPNTYSVADSFIYSFDKTVQAQIEAHNERKKKRGE
jgi:hypothetical protein